MRQAIEIVHNGLPYKRVATNYMKACTHTNAINGIKTAGIILYDPDIFSANDIVAAEATELDQEPTE